MAPLLPCLPTPTVAPVMKAESTKLSMLIDTMKQFVAMLNTQSKPSAPTDSLLVSMPPTLPVAMLQLSSQEHIVEIEKELSALHAHVYPCKQVALKPPATHKNLISAPMPALTTNSVPAPMPALKVRPALVPSPEFDNMPHIVFISCPTISMLKAAHGPVFPSIGLLMNLLMSLFWHLHPQPLYWFLHTQLPQP